ncbi:MAG: hypothetical protein V3T26_05945 [candidate division NC10 bacterium]
MHEEINVLRAMVAWALEVERRKERYLDARDGTWYPQDEEEAFGYMDGWADGYYAGVDCMDCESGCCPDHEVAA